MKPLIDSGRREWRAFLLALLLVVPLCAFNLFRHELWRPAEAREAGIACDMLESGNFAATTLNFALFLEKPPLYTWAIAVPLHLFGRHAWAVRIPVLIFSLGTLALLYLLARRCLGRGGAVASVVLLASMGLFVEINHGAMIDNGMLFFIMLAMLSFFRMDEEAVRAAGRGRFWTWSVLFYAALGAVFLCKGAIGVLLVLGGAGLYFLVCRRWALLRPGPIVLGGFILSLMVGGWLLALWRRGGAEYFRVFFVVNHLQRLSGVYGPSAPWHYYIPGIFVAVLPWTTLLPGGIAVAVRQMRRSGLGGAGARNFWIFLACWVGWMFVLLSASAGKDNQYILPILPPLALVCGAWVEDWLADGKVTRWAWGLAAIPVVFLAVALPILPWVPAVVHRTFSAGALAWELVLAGVSLLTVRAFFRDCRREAAGLLAVQIVLFGCISALFIEPLLDERKSTLPLVEFTKSSLPAGATLHAFALNENTEGALIFYGLRPKRLVTLEDAARLAASSEPAVVLASTKHGPCEFKDQLLATQGWRVVAEATHNKHHCWLLANAAVAQ